MPADSIVRPQLSYPQQRYCSSYPRIPRRRSGARPGHQEPAGVGRPDFGAYIEAVRGNGMRAPQTIITNITASDGPCSAEKSPTVSLNCGEASPPTLACTRPEIVILWDELLLCR